MAITGSFSSGVLTVQGDTLDNNPSVSRDAAGNILVNGGAVAISGGRSTVANTSRIDVFGQGGNDTITLSETNGALPAANLFGGAGNDVLTSGSGNDQVFGEAGNDTLLGKGGNDLLFGGADNDTLTGGDGDDQMFGQAGNDRMIWNAGDDSDLMEGGEGNDTAEVNGGNGSEIFTATANGARVRFDRVNPAPFSLDIGTTENIVVNMNGGDDTFSASGNLAALTSFTVDGGDGNDNINGGNGADVLLGGNGNDFIDGNQGSDVVFLGAGDDTFQWDPGDGNDVVEGQDGNDAMLFNGANINEIFDVSANGERARFLRNVANVTMDLNDVERVDIRALGGADVINVHDLRATEIRQVAVNLAETTDVADNVVLSGRTTGENFSFADQGDALLARGVGADVVVSNFGALDRVVAAGTAGVTDTFTVAGANAADTLDVTANGSEVLVSGLNMAVAVRGNTGDRLLINGNAGDDVINASGNLAALTQLTLDGGAGNDRISGGNGVDVLIGGDGNDFVDGQQGNDVALLGAGDDVFQWDPGDGNDIVEGQAGTDTLIFNGAAINETFVISANGGRERLTRDIANVAMDLEGIEKIEAHAGAGNDLIDASALPANRMQLSLFGDAGDDRIIGSAGADFINGGIGTDTVSMGAGNDRFQWNPGEGSDVIDGQAGFDTHEFNGANVGERFSLTRGGGDVILTRDVGNIVMDQDNVERVELAVRGGADAINIADLRGSDVREVLVDLAGATAGTADGAVDTITVDAGVGTDVLTLGAAGGDLTVNGLSHALTIANLDSTDRLLVKGSAAADLIDASSVAASAVVLALDGGDGNDVLLASRGATSMQGGAGNDLLVGNAGNDVLDGGAGNDALFGGGGNDLFSGDDDFTVIDFRAGAGAGDRLDLRDVAGADDLGDVFAAVHGITGGVMLDFGDQEITLLGVSAAQLNGDDFLI